MQAAADGLSIDWRDQVEANDVEIVRRLCKDSEVFSPAEVSVAAELVQERLEKGPDSGYFFIFAQRSGRVLGYASYGPIPCTQDCWDIYWIVTDRSARRQGLGGAMLDRAEELIKEAGGRRVYIETSSRDVYEAPRCLYSGHGYVLESLQSEFYAPGDHKHTYVKKLK